MKSKWKTLSSRIDYQNRWMTVHKDLLQSTDQKLLDYYYVSLNTFVKVIAVNDNNKIAFAKNYRYVVKTNQLELPAGVIEEGENLEASALRELKEETGIIAKNCEVLGEIYTTNGISDQKGFVVLVTDLTLSDPEPTEFEEISPVVFYSTDEIKKLITDNEITDGPALAALMLYFSKNNL